MIGWRISRVAVENGWSLHSSHRPTQPALPFLSHPTPSFVLSLATYLMQSSISNFADLDIHLLSCLDRHPPTLPVGGSHTPPTFKPALSQSHPSSIFTSPVHSLLHSLASPYLRLTICSLSPSLLPPFVLKSDSHFPPSSLLLAIHPCHHLSPSLTCGSGRTPTRGKGRQQTPPEWQAPARLTKVPSSLAAK